MRLSEPRRAAAVLALGLGLLASQAACNPSTPSWPAAGPTQCAAQESVLFSCETGKKVVSLCAKGKPGAFDAISYRYGLPGKVELEYQATSGNGLLFHGQVEPAAPNASVREVWFDKGSTRYLMTACEGGDCPYASGLAVLSRGKVLSSQHCVRTTPDRGFFAPEFADFGSSLNDSRSHTPLLKLETDENLIEQLYPAGGER